MQETNEEKKKKHTHTEEDVGLERNPLSSNAKHFYPTT